MIILENAKDLRGHVASLRRAGKTIAFVPTMGALHDGHLELVRQGLAVCDVCIPYIFVNPKQFAPTEDFGSYPRTVEADAGKLSGAGADALYLPREEDIYPPNFVTSISVAGPALPLEGEFRPHFFSGVATVVAKMLLQCLPDMALFGEKDWQQLTVIRAMVRDLNIPVEVKGVPTVREADGLALSSRNAYLSADERKIAPSMNIVLRDMAVQLSKGKPVAAIEAEAIKRLLAVGFQSVDYMTVRDADSLLPPAAGTKNIRILGAARLGKARLIDNIAA